MSGNDPCCLVAGRKSANARRTNARSLNVYSGASRIVHVVRIKEAYPT